MSIQEETSRRRRDAKRESRMINGMCLSMGAGVLIMAAFSAYGNILIGSLCAIAACLVGIVISHRIFSRYI